MKPVAATVSILIPCYNAERWIAEAIESALGQTWEEKEVIVVDDGSTDNSVNIIKGYADSIQFETGPNRGGNVARNRLLELACGDWLQYLDSDDCLLPEKVAGQMSADGASEADVLFGPVTLEHWEAGNSRRELLEIPEPHDEWILLARWYLPQTGASLWRKQALLDVGGWKPDQPCCQEHELYFRLLSAGKRFRYCATNGAIYRQWSQDTVCTRDLPEVHTQRLKIEQMAEELLESRGELTSARRSAINQARFEIARIAWQYSPARASKIVARMRESQPDFSPVGNAAPGTIGWHIGGWASRTPRGSPPRDAA